MSTIRMDKHIHAPRARVYRALIDPSAVARWMVPDGMTSRVHAFDAREGGAFRISLTYQAPDAQGKSGAHTDTYHGRFVKLVPDSELVQSMEFETDQPALRGQMTLRIVLTDAANGGTLLSASHENVPEGVPPADNELGWQMSLGKLAALVERGE
jgi:uncharacterized protein YndB with AHSA1/START domain